MKKFKYLFVLPAVSLMALTSCADNGKNPYEALPEETSAEIIEELKINERQYSFNQQIKRWL